MKRARETDVDMPVDVTPGRVVGAWMTPPPAARPAHARAHFGPQHTPARMALFPTTEAAISPWKQPPLARTHPTHKRRRDCSVPMDALSRLMSAAVTSARLKKHGMTPLFGAAPPPPAPSCGVCAPVAGRQATPAVASCAHCERSVGACCRRECAGCGGDFCSLCSTLNCDEQFDRVFCLACNYELGRS